MKRINGFTIALLVFVIFILGRMYFTSDSFNLRCVISDIDGKQYCVRERKQLHKVADLLARVTNKMKELNLYMKKQYPNKENVKRLYENFNPHKIYEILPTSKFTAYSENKGEKMAFCVTKQKKGNKLIDENTLTFVAIHELGHIMTESIGHTEEFWNNFKFLLKNAVKMNIYQPIDYSKEPHTYCGMKITDNPYYS